MVFIATLCRGVCNSTVSWWLQQHCVVVFAAGRSTTDTELESMLESGNPAIFTQGVSCCPFSYAYSCLRKVAIIIVFIRHGSIYRKCHDISPISIILVSRCFGALDISCFRYINIMFVTSKISVISPHFIILFRTFLMLI